MIYPPGILQIVVKEIKEKSVVLSVRLMGIDGKVLKDFGFMEQEIGQQRLTGAWRWHGHSSIA